MKRCYQKKYLHFSVTYFSEIKLLGSKEPIETTIHSSVYKHITTEIEKNDPPQTALQEHKTQPEKNAMYVDRYRHDVNDHKKQAKIVVIVCTSQGSLYYPLSKTQVVIPKSYLKLEIKLGGEKKTRSENIYISGVLVKEIRFV